VDDDHLEDPQDVQAGMIGVPGQDDDRQAEVPGVFRVVLRPPALGAKRLPEYLLQLVDLDYEPDLLFKTG